MSYESERAEKKRKKKRIFFVVGMIATILLSVFFVIASFYPPSTWKYSVHLPEVARRKEGEMRFHFLDVGQGDCTIVELPDGKTMMIDGGNGEQETTNTVMRYLSALKIKTLDFLVLTHSDSDHAGGLDTVLKTKTVKKVYYPKIDDFSINDEFASFCSALQKSGADKEYSEVGKSIVSSGKYPYRIGFLSPSSVENPKGEYAEVNGGNESDFAINDTSAVLLFEYGQTKTLLMGDASSEIEEKIMLADQKGVWDFGELAGLTLSADILKVSHHGSSTATSEEFLEYLGAKTAVISCGKKNLYGHPDNGVMHRLLTAGEKTHRTDEEGTGVISIPKEGEYTIE